MGLPLDKKLEQLGAAGRARLGRAWGDPDTTIRMIEQRFGMGPPDIARLKELLGAKAKAEPGYFAHGQLQRPRRSA